MISDPFDLQRFIDAQTGVIERALRELREGRKTTHWVWFVFPQLRGLGASYMADRYGIEHLAEARAYHAHSLLGPRLHACTEAAMRAEIPSLRELFGTPDDLKFHSCMTLFARAVPESPIFTNALERWWDGHEDSATLALLARQAA